MIPWKLEKSQSNMTFEQIWPNSKRQPKRLFRDVGSLQHLFVYRALSPAPGLRGIAACPGQFRTLPQDCTVSFTHPLGFTDRSSPSPSYSLLSGKITMKNTPINRLVHVNATAKLQTSNYLPWRLSRFPWPFALQANVSLLVACIDK